MSARDDVTEKIFHALTVPSDLDGQRLLLIEYLDDAATYMATNPSEAMRVAYDIAGLMATDYVRSLDPSDPIDAIFVIAGELETRPADSVILTQELIDRIRNLET